MEYLLTLKGLFIPVAHAGAWDIYCEAMGNCGSGKYFLIEFAVRASTFVFMAIGGISIIAILWGASKFITSAFNDQGRESGKDIIKFALFGLILAIMAAAFVRLVQGLVVMIIS